MLEALHERGLLIKNAPHLVKDQAFIIPAYSWWSGPFYSLGMKIYDRMAGKLGLGSSRRVDKDEALKLAPNLSASGLVGGVVYHDGQFDDSRLAINLAQTASELGGTLINYCKITELSKGKSGKVTGVIARDQTTNNSYQISGKAVINATGVFVDDILSLDQKSHVKSVVPSQGIHLVLDAKFLQGSTAIMIPKTSDGRVLFAVPWHDKVILGTTDTLVEHTSLEPVALEEEIAFILETAREYLSKPPKRSDVKSIFAGLRPLAADSSGQGKTKEISRSHKIITSPSKLITVIGGKWTTYRKMAEEIVNNAEVISGLKRVPCKTEQLLVHGGSNRENANSRFEIYGSDSAHIKNLCDQDPSLLERLHPRLPYLNAEVIWGCRHEMAITVEDILARRTRAILLDAKASLEAAPNVARLMAKELNQDENWIDQQISNYSKVIEGYLLPKIT